MSKDQNTKVDNFDLFISHSSADKIVTVQGRSFNLIEFLKRQLEQHFHPTDLYSGRPRRFRVCTYEEDFELKKSVPMAIQNSLKLSSAMLVVCSQASSKSDWVNSEIKLFTEQKPNQPLLAGTWNLMPDQAFPDYFGSESLAADLAPSVAWSYQDWLKKLKAECHKIVANAWDLPLEKVHDRFELGRKRRRSRYWLIGLCVLAICVALISLTIKQRISIQRDKEHRAAIISLKNHGYVVDEGDVDQTVGLIFKPPVDSEFAEPIHNHATRGLKAAKNLRRIDSIRLHGATISDQTISELQALPPFRELWLQRTKVTDRSIPVIQSLDGLEVLNLLRTQVSKNGIKTLQVARSNWVIEASEEKFVDLSGWEFGDSLNADDFGGGFRDTLGRGLTDAEWSRVFEYSKEHAALFGYPEKRQDSLLIGSFNIRKLGRRERRSLSEWLFLAKILEPFDLIAVQEIIDLQSIRFLLDLLGSSFDMSFSPTTGYASYLPDEKKRGYGERLAFFYNRRMVRKTEMGGTLEIGSSHIIEALARQIDDFAIILKNYKEQMKVWQSRVDQVKQEGGRRPLRPNIFRLKLPSALDFLRTPYTESFVLGKKRAENPYRFLAVNCHLIWGQSPTIRWNEFELLFHRAVAESVERKRKKAGYEDIVVFGQLNTKYEKPESDRLRIDSLFEPIVSPEEPKAYYPFFVNFPFLDIHPNRESVFRTNLRGTQTYDHIGFIAHDQRLPSAKHNLQAGFTKGGYDYGVFDFVELIHRALIAGESNNLTKEMEAEKKKQLIRKIEHRISDHLPIWVRLPLPS